MLTSSRAISLISMGMARLPPKPVGGGMCCMRCRRSREGAPGGSRSCDAMTLKLLYADQCSKRSRRAVDTSCRRCSCGKGGRGGGRGEWGVR